MKKYALRFIAASMLSMACAGPALAAPYLLNYSGVANGTNSPFTASLTLDLSSNGAVATLISGIRNGVAITGLSNYASADNRLSFNNPYVSFSGLSYITTAGTSYNFYYNTIGDFAVNPGVPGYGEINSVSSPSGNSAGDRVSFASVNGVTISGAVPEPASWAMMILGMGVVGYALRRKVRASEVRFDDRIKRIAAGEVVA